MQEFSVELIKKLRTTIPTLIASELVGHPIGMSTQYSYTTLMECKTEQDIIAFIDGFEQEQTEKCVIQ